MRSIIPPALLAELRAAQYTPFLLFAMTIDDMVYRRTDCDVAIVESGNAYDPIGMEVRPIQYSMNRIVDQLDMEFDNLDQVFTSIFIGGTPQGSEASLHVVVLDSSNAVIDKALLFQGEIDTWSLDETKLSVTIASILSRWSQKTIFLHPVSCRWKEFKGAECTYPGDETWCNRTYTRCSQLSNTDNYGGFRWLPSIIDKIIWWGRTPGPEDVSQTGLPPNVPPGSEMGPGGPDIGEATGIEGIDVGTGEEPWG